jgi:hypothetical protein
MDMLRLANESTIAVGNMRTNARGDELGTGGKVVKTRSQIMHEYNKLNTPVPMDHPISDRADLIADTELPVTQVVAQAEVTNLTTPMADDTPVVESTEVPQYVKPRGSFADSVAKQTEVTQELLEPASSRNSDNNNGGVSRI